MTYSKLEKNISSYQGNKILPADHVGNSLDSYFNNKINNKSTKFMRLEAKFMNEQCYNINPLLKENFRQLHQ